MARDALQTLWPGIGRVTRMVSVSAGIPPGAARHTAGKLAAETPERPGILIPAVDQDLPPAGWGIECQREPLPAGTKGCAVPGRADRLALRPDLNRERTARPIDGSHPEGPSQ